MTNPMNIGDLIECFTPTIPFTGAALKPKLYYLASPYSHSNPMIREMRYVLVEAIGAALYNLGYNLLEPISGSHPKACKYELPKGYQYWSDRDRLMIERSDGVIVCKMKGWERSVGVTDEVAYAVSIGKPVYYLDPNKFLVDSSLNLV